MPDGLPPLGRLARERAVEAIEGWLAALRGRFRRLSPGELERRRSVDVVLGWRIEMVLPEGTFLKFDILADQEFPYSPPRIAVIVGNRAPAWPHVENDGVMCLLPNSATTDPDDPLTVLQTLMGDAANVVEDSLSGRNHQDFLDEFTSYWVRDLPSESVAILSLAKMTGPSRTVRVALAEGSRLVADDDETALSWLSNTGQKATTGHLRDGLFLWMDRPPYPHEYPNDGAGLLRMVEQRSPDAADTLKAMLAKEPDELVILFAAPTRNGPGVAGVLIGKETSARWPGGPRRAGPHSGFRGGSAPPSLVARRQLGTARIWRCRASRADAPWIHGRGLDSGFDVLRNAKVAVLGCGSLGAPIAVRLAQAGVGTLYLVDADRLDAANTGRHPLDRARVGANKAKALAAELRGRFPHVKCIEGLPMTWERAYAARPDLLGSCDLIVAAMAHWTSDTMLNDWHLRQGRRMPVVYAWTEAHACAGHAVMIGHTGGCLRCGFSRTGTPSLRVTEWPGKTLSSEPACGAMFQPYGPTELAHVEALAAEVALDALLRPPQRSTHRIWAGRHALLSSAGGEWSEEWLALHPQRQSGAFMDERPWPEGVCGVCGVDGHTSEP